jgi:hypothetical protein
LYRHLPLDLCLHVSYLTILVVLHALTLTVVCLSAISPFISSIWSPCRVCCHYLMRIDDSSIDVGTCIAAGGLYCLTPALTVWVGLNTAGQTKRAASISIVFFAAAIGGVPGSYIYIAKEARKFMSSRTGFESADPLSKVSYRVRNLARRPWLW